MKPCEKHMPELLDTLHVLSHTPRSSNTSNYRSRNISLKVQQQSRMLMQDEQQRIMSGIAVEAISRNASGAFTAIASSILPFVFFAKHDPVEAIREPFVETWSENTGGAGAIKLYIREIMTLVARYLEDPKWRIKQVSALALANACEAIGIDIREHLGLVMPLLLKGVGGRTWKGKEAVLKALVVVVENAKESYSPTELEEISKV
jgi:proteasome component ECM29